MRSSGGGGSAGLGRIDGDRDAVHQIPDTRVAAALGRHVLQRDGASERGGGQGERHAQLRRDE
ncbi:MAG TPA: hypothetical protein VGD73_04040 [Pseudonocardia sp.]|jgi:hypothetical protein